MQQIFLILLLVLGGASYWLYNENQTLKENNVKLELAVEEQKEAMEAIKKSYETQGKALLNMQSRNAQIEAEKAEYLDIFRRHNLNKLAEAKPGLIETRINKGTAAVFGDIENDSKELSNLNSANNPN
jgi:hypothetical protein|tara:strand:+ start:232 stop:615 length:384 start_codon:yes stop_codon:yes gene_type:complete